jgi:hypothetical protein
MHLSVLATWSEIVGDICQWVDILKFSIGHSRQTTSVDTNEEYSLINFFLISAPTYAHEWGWPWLKAPHGGRNICCQGLEKLDKMSSGLMNQITWVFP